MCFFLFQNCFCLFVILRMAHASASHKDWDLQETTGRCIPNSST